jgi:hypothetical protein
MRLINRLIKLETKQQQQQATCYPIDWFYGIESKPVPLIPNQTLADFYNQLNKEVLHD